MTLQHHARGVLLSAFCLGAWFLVGEAAAAQAAAQAPAETQAQAKDDSPKIVNIINFVRQCEPRIDWITEDVLYETVVSQVASIKEHDLRGTFLLQYDALMEERYRELFKGLPTEQFEIGAWWEIPQPLVENAGYEWRGRFPWDWHADVGFATGYSPAEREKLVDTYMADFKELFGAYPKSVGSWFIDAHTLLYMYEKYGIAASCNCKDQIGTDGYTLWGGYWSQGYYPSKSNAYMPAQNASQQIPVPIFRMLGSDPIHQYDSGLGTDRQRVISLEPVYMAGGGDPDWCKWYFDALVDGPAMNFGYVQAGQENSFTWKRMREGFEIRMPLIAKLRKEGKLVVQTLGETGEWFTKKYPVTPPTSVTVLNDLSEKDQKTVWFNSRFYRANLLWEQGTMRFRDIHLFDERVASNYLTKASPSTKCFYYALPVVDGFRWSSMDTVAGLRLKTGEGLEVQGSTPVVDDSTEGQLVVQWPTESPKGSVVMTFTEGSLRIAATGALKDDWYFELSSDPAAKRPFTKVEAQSLTCEFEQSPYAVTASHGTFSTEAGSPLRITPGPEGIALDFSAR